MATERCRTTPDDTPKISSGSNPLIMNVQCLQGVHFSRLKCSGLSNAEHIDLEKVPNISCAGKSLTESTRLCAGDGGEAVLPEGVRGAALFLSRQLDHRPEAAQSLRVKSIKGRGGVQTLNSSRLCLAALASALRSLSLRWDAFAWKLSASCLTCAFIGGGAFNTSQARAVKGFQAP